eukprot:gnl/MRDRNA2_/MRDRNA2_79464_c0_seq1.p1 gnl/MRDRNA2_/MRDRNA2_79464_c0~~gnl/MRDRNA2_/MRDRNA2_79464_c0_seq1.p1  ORF type:complete len:495 (+),score=59.80 gnl/MRDRNA2_/MRDRNA2_79464_c0_seq1:79-1485(+)
MSTPRVGGEYEGRAVDGAWWPLTVVGINPDGTLEAEVHDGYGSRWSRIPCCNIRGRGGGGPLIQPGLGNIPQPPPGIQQPAQPQVPPQLQQSLQPQPGGPLHPMQPPMSHSPYGQIGMQPRVPYIGGLMPELDRSEVYQQQVQPPLMSPPPPQLLQPPLAQQLPQQPQIPVPQSTIQPGTYPHSNAMPAHNVHALSQLSSTIQQQVHALQQQQQLQHQQQRLQYENALNLQRLSTMWAAQHNALWTAPATLTPQQPTSTQHLPINAPPAHAPSVALPPKEDQATPVRTIKAEREDACSISTPSLVNDDRSSNSLTPRAHSRDGSESPPMQLNQSSTALNQSHKSEEQRVPAEYKNEELHAPAEVLKTLAKLTQIVGDGHYRREDMETHEATKFLYPYIPVNEEGNVTSLGSILHIEGSCTPCAFHKKNRCHKKDLCIYCHYDHDAAAPKSRPRKSKKKRVREAAKLSA